MPSFIFLPYLPPFQPGVDFVHVAGGVYGHEEAENVMRVMQSKHLTAGPWHKKLEDDLAIYYGTRYARLVNSGSSANLLAVAALMSPLLGERALRPGDEVITVAAGFPTTVAPLFQLGLIPTFVDSTGPTWNIWIDGLERARHERTKAVILAHTLGNPFDVDAVKAFCKKHGLWLIEDNCDAAGSLYKGKMTGTFGDIATLSFYPAHHMTTGEGGAVLTSNPTLRRATTSLRDWGRDCWCPPAKDNTCGKRFEQQHGDLPYGYDHKYVYSHAGYNLKMTDMQAAVGVAQLAKLPDFITHRKSNWNVLRSELDSLSDVLALPEAQHDSDPSWFGFLVTVRSDAKFTRDDLVRELEKRRIQTRMLFAGNLMRQPGFRKLPFHSRACPGADYVMERALWVGVYPGITQPMLEWMVKSFKEICHG
jgi:CDP-4-dehydro-6-deoxyglucose reductase, E1